MYLRLCSLVLSLGLVQGSLQAQERVVDSSYIFSGYKERLALFQQMPTQPGAIVFLGNSLTEAGRWNDIIPHLPVLNRGISGDNSFGVVARLAEITKHQPKKVFLMIGVNDLKKGTPKEYIIQNYHRIVEQIKRDSPKTQIYLNSILPINPTKLIEAFKQVKNSDIAELNMALQKLAAKHKQVTYMDLYPVVADSQGYLKEELTPDGIHLEVSAYIPVVDYLFKRKAL